MFIEKYVSKLYFDIICGNYDEYFINGLDETNFFEVYKMFRKYNFYFVNEIILNYLEIFDMDSNDVELGIINLKNKLGNNFVRIIGDDMTYLDEIINNDKDVDF